MKRWDREMHKCDLNIIILGHDLHENEVNYTFENFNLNPTLNPNPNPKPNNNEWSI
jgi:hypothetical protein